MHCTECAALDTRTVLSVLSVLNALAFVGERWDSRKGERRWVGERNTSVPGLARSWQAVGATIIGGCCRVLPDEIAAIRSEVIR
jgi:S-methylmethionine-dependent homocysteine/selenocysteine methylase